MALADAESGPGDLLGQFAGGLEVLGLLEEDLQLSGGGVHAAHNAEAVLEVQRSLNVALLPVSADGTESAEVEDLELGLDALLDVERAQLHQHGGAVVEHAAGNAPVEGGGVKGAHLDTGNVLVVQHTHGVAVGGVVGDAVVAGGGAVDDDVAVLVGTDGLDGLVELHGVHDAHALVVTHVQVGNGGTQLPALVDLSGDLLGGLGNIKAAGGDSTGHSGGNDFLCH